MRAPAACCLLVLTVLTPAASAPPERQTAAPAAPVVELLDAYDTGRFETVDKILAGIPDLASFSIALQRAAYPWITAANPDGVQRRRLVAAAAGLEAAREHVGEREAGRELVEWGGMLARAGPPTDAERTWYLAAIALAQWLYEPTSPQIAHAARRFPAEDRFHLAGAILRESASWRRVQVAQRLNKKDDAKDILRDVVKAFEPLLQRESIRGEVHLRLGNSYLRRDQPKAALEHLALVEPLAPADPFLRYLANYLSGKAHDALKDAAAAEAAYQRALAVVPRAQSASFARAALAFDRDARDEAHAVIDAALSWPAPADDPWRAYQAADARFWPEFIARLRKELR